MTRIAGILLIALAGGCATVLSNGKQPVEFTTSPQGAEVLVDGKPAGTTPVAAYVDRKTGTTLVTIRKAGFETKQFMLGKTLNAIAILNLSSAFFWATDFTSGNLIEYAPHAYYVELTPAGNPRPPGYSRERSRALRFVLVSRHHVLNDIARRRGEYLRTLARLFAVGEEAYPRFVEALAGEAASLAALEEEPHELFRAIFSLLDERGLIGWTAKSPLTARR